MKRWIWLTLAAVIVIGAGVTLVAVPAEQEWTTSSPEALAEFELAVDARFKLYEEEELRHLERAVELDPNFALARLWTLKFKFHEDEESAKAEWDEILATDTSKLTPRERFYIERSRLIRAERLDEVDPLLHRYLTDYPNDPYIVYENADQHWRRDELDEAEPLYRRLVEIAPNWVIAYNMMGYITMGQGRFEEAQTLSERAVEIGSDALGADHRVVLEAVFEDARALAGSVVSIVETVRSVTQPDVLEMANDATDVLHHADEVEILQLREMLLGEASQLGEDVDIERGELAGETHVLALRADCQRRLVVRHDDLRLLFFVENLHRVDLRRGQRVRERRVENERVANGQFGNERLINPLIASGRVRGRPSSTPAGNVRACRV